MLSVEKELEFSKGLALDQAIFLAKQKKKKATPKPVTKPKQGGKKK